MSKQLPSSGTSPNFYNNMRNLRRRAYKDASRRVHIRKTNGGRIPRKRKKFVTRAERRTFAELNIKITIHLMMEPKE